MPLLTAAGIPLPSGDLTVGAEVGVDRADGEKRSFKVPDEKVFEIQLSRIRLKRGKGSGASRALKGEKPKWVPQWDTRGSWAEDDEGVQDWESEEEEEFLEADFGEDSDEDEELMLQSGEVGKYVCAQKPGEDASGSC